MKLMEGGMASDATSKTEGAIRCLEALKLAFDMRGANATTVERAIDTLRSDAARIAALEAELAEAKAERDVAREMYTAMARMHLPADSLVSEARATAAEARAEKPAEAVDAAIDAFQQIIKIDRAYTGVIIEVAPGVGGRGARDRDGPSAAIARAALRALAETKP